MSHNELRSAAFLTPLLLGVALSAGCGDDSSKNDKRDPDDEQGQDAGTDAAQDPDESGVQGIAAFGAAVKSGKVEAKCENEPGTLSVTTNAKGEFELPVPEGAYPCVLRVTEGNLPAGMPALHSWAAQPGVANITPLTDIALAMSVEHAVGGSLEAFFESPSEWSKVGPGLKLALSELRKALLNAGYTLPEAWSQDSAAPFSAPFTPDPKADAFDQLFEALGAAVAASEYEDYAAFVAAVKGGGSFPAAPEGTEQPGNTVAATVHPELVKSYTLTFYVDGGSGCGSACSYQDGQEVSVTVGQNNTLSVGGKTLSNPFHFVANGKPLTTEVVWRDGDLAYALSDNNTGAFHEINVGQIKTPGSLPSFLGQMRAASQGGEGNPLITQFAGSYQASLMYRGATLPSWTSFSIGQDGSFAFTNGPSIAANQISSVTDRMACCGRVDVAVNFDLNGSGAVDNRDSFNLWANASGELHSIEILGTGVRVDEITVLTHDGSALPETNNLVAATLRLPGAEPRSAEATLDDQPALTFTNSLTLGGSLSAGEPPVLQHRFELRIERDKALATGQVIPCYENNPSGDTTRLSVTTGPLNTDMYSSADGGFCTFTLTAVETTQGYYSLVEGTFTGELYSVKRNNPPLIVNDGVFRWVPTLPF